MEKTDKMHAVKKMNKSSSHQLMCLVCIILVQNTNTWILKFSIYCNNSTCSVVHMLHYLNLQSN